MVKLRVKVGSKGQIVIPKVLRDKLKIEPGKYVTIEAQEDKIIIKRKNVDELVEWLKKNRKPVAKDVSKFSIEDEFDEDFS